MCAISFSFFLDRFYFRNSIKTKELFEEEYSLPIEFLSITLTTPLKVIHKSIPNKNFKMKFLTMVGSP